MLRPTVYFARAGTDGPIKIGFTSGDPAARIAKLQTGCPWPIALLGTMPGSTEDEARLHVIFAAHRVEGEWFAPADEVLTGVEALLAGEFQWPCQAGAKRELPVMPTIGDIIWAAGGPNKIAAASRGEISVDAVHKWRRNGIRDWHWALLMSLCDVSVEQLYRANRAGEHRDEAEAA